MKPITRISTLLVLISVAFLSCEKEEADDRPDFIFQGTLTDVTDGSPKTGWDVFLWQAQRPVFPPPTVVPIVSFGNDTIAADGRFSMDVTSYSDKRRAGEEWFNNDPERKREYYNDYRLFFRAPGPYNDIDPTDLDYLILDPDDKDLLLENFDFTTKGEVITRDIQVFTGGRGRVNCRYEIERPVPDQGSISFQTSIRDLSYDRPYFIYAPGFQDLTEPGRVYLQTLGPPVGREVEAVTTFRTTQYRSDAGSVVVVDSLVLRDTFLIQSLSDTLQERTYVY
ncbi:hypothetical protein FUA23_18850 [Neolewinella aurantiaca]|uniref:Uncharacterized protein n=1 Tax=Neolewinella aurantiaca TaxID=2602767 RepID=A0A5C7FQT1_9BACT|nr:hypothetical protein [Neolewinella aurantiaca]TXF87055.1 hypothetical protein FUA23_18850 [Neolewinella aurantiaca]